MVNGKPEKRQQRPLNLTGKKQLYMKNIMNQAAISPICRKNGKMPNNQRMGQKICTGFLKERYKP